MTKEELIERSRGCLVGGAVGDALGYEIEFDSAAHIRRRFGRSGITEYVLHGGKALISDDTQMTLFTANGLLYADTNCPPDRICTPSDYAESIGLCYRDWLLTQYGDDMVNGATVGKYAWLNGVPELNSRRAPGNTCMTALRMRTLGSTERPVNDSKGCGGVMRVAPVGIYLGARDAAQYDIDMTAAEAAALTHGHELGYIPAAMLAHMVSLAACSEDMTLEGIVADACAAAGHMFPECRFIGDMLDIIGMAAELAVGKGSDGDCIERIGKGFVGEEALAIAVFCVLRYRDDFEKCIIAAVNHGGDSDSTGAVAGNILGAYLGYGAIPEKFRTNLEALDTMIEVADDLCADVAQSRADAEWQRKYGKR